MSFIGYMLCIIVALIIGISLGRYSKKEKPLEYQVPDVFIVRLNDKLTGEVTMSTLKKVLEKYGALRMYDVCLLTNSSEAPFESYFYGWRNLDGVEMKLNSEGQMDIRFPKPIQLEKYPNSLMDKSVK